MGLELVKRSSSLRYYVGLSMPRFRGEGAVKWSGVMKKSVRKNPHAVALGRLGGAVRSEAKQLANQENGRKGGLAKSRRKTLACRRNARLPRLGRRKRSRP